MSQNNGRCGWTKFSETRLIEVEKKILEILKTAYRTWFVPVKGTFGNDDNIWTIQLNGESKNTPLVLLHGFAAGLCFWCLNFDCVAKDRPVYAIDLLGFGRSSRPNFSNDSLEAENQMVESLEEWRKQVNLEKFILLGHSFGGYLATSYAINHPDRVKHLILADPWGFTEKPARIEAPFLWRVLGLILYPLTYLNPLATLRAVGPIGPWLVNKARSDISEKFSAAVENKEIITEYIYHCNSQKPSGEAAFQCMRQSFAWAKNPMIHRFQSLRNDIPVTILYGEKSWLRRIADDVYKAKRPDSFLSIQIIPDAGHHINADQPLLFNEVVKKICSDSDAGVYDDEFEFSRKTTDSANNSDNDKHNVEIEEYKDNIEILQLNTKRDL